jgi:hypothetical protein
MSESNETSTQQALAAAVVRLLRPLVRILLRYGVPFGVFADLAKRVYVDVARSEFAITDRKQTTSRVSVLTGLSRKEVRRVEVLEMPEANAEAERYNRAARVISGWRRDRRYHDEAGEPASLELEGEASFTELVRAYSGDVPARAILDELVRVGAAERDGDGRIRLCVRAYVPSTAEVDKLEILGTDVAALAATIDHNLTAEPGGAWFQRKVAYDNLPVEALEGLRAEAGENGQRLLEALDVSMARLDRDANPEAGGTGRKQVLVGVYYYESDAGDGEQGENS